MQLAKPILEGHVKDSFTGDGATTTFPLSFAPSAPSAVLIFLDGLYQTETEDYNIAAKAVTFIGPPTAGAKIRAVYSAEFNG
jgi:hypothetical protein